MASKLARGIYTPSAPLGWLLRSKLGDQCKPKFYVSKPKKFNRELFELMPAFEVTPD